MGVHQFTMTRQTRSLVSFVAWVLVIGSAVHGHQVAKRQLYLPSVSLGCVTGFFSLEPTQQQCLFGFGDSISINGSSINIELSPSELDRACGVAGCRIGLTKLIEACEVSQLHSELNNYYILATKVYTFVGKLCKEYIQRCTLRSSLLNILTYKCYQEFMIYKGESIQLSIYCHDERFILL